MVVRGSYLDDQFIWRIAGIYNSYFTGRLSSQPRSQSRRKHFVDVLYNHDRGAQRGRQIREQTRERGGTAGGSSNSNQRKARFRSSARRFRQSQGTNFFAWLADYFAQNGDLSQQ